ncbi:MAG: DUF3326 domain-containing protein [Cyanobacteria bacterium J06632_22]
MSQVQTARAQHTTVLVVPTGIGAAIGGYAGDALPVARAIAAVTDTLITHPNVLNGAQLYWPLPNALYVEGYGLDQFAAGRWGLHPVHQNRIGLLLDAAIEADLRQRHLQAADATRATLGLDLTDYVVTDAPLGVTLRTAHSGATWGTIENPGSLLRGCERLIEAGAEAFAVIARFPDDEDSDALIAYRQGHGVDPLAGAEAVISHLVVKTFQRPCAHAPALQPLPLDPTVSPRAAAEEIGYTFLPCVLAGLSRAPQFAEASGGGLQAHHVNAAIFPARAFGGSAALSLAQTGATLIAVDDNQTKTQVSAGSLGIKAVHVSSYLEAVGVLACQKASVNWRALHPQVRPLQKLP